MKILFITQKVDRDDDLLGYVRGWIECLTNRVDKVTVICLQKGSVSLSGHVRVYSLGKENGVSRVKYLIRFFTLIFRLRHDYDVVFVHMNQAYVLLGGVLWRFWGKKIVLWKTHYRAGLSLKVAVLLVHRVVSALPSSFQASARKLVAIGHGIDTRLFSSPRLVTRKSRVFRLIFTGRISPVKRLETLITALHLLKKKGIFCILHLYGRAGSIRDEPYVQKLISMIRDLDVQDEVIFSGWRANRDMPCAYEENDALVNLTPSGSFDKAILEAMAMEKLILVCNALYRSVLSKELQSCMMFREEDAADLVHKIETLMTLDERTKMSYGKNLRQIVVEHHSLDRFIEKLVGVFEKILR